MSIYSANRFGSMTLSQVPANEAYGCNDLGRILYESQVNDMAFFEAILASDFREIQGLREGTLLESEIESLNEASFKTMIASLKERLKKFWAKIKAAFKDACTKIAAYVLRDGKAFVTNFRNTCNKYHDWTGSINNVTRYNTGAKAKHCDVPSADDVNKIITANKSNNGNIYNKNEYVKKVLCEDMLGEKDVEVSEYVKKVLEKNKIENNNISTKDVTALCDVVSNGRKSIKDLRDAERKAKANIDSVGKVLINAERASDNESKDNNITNIATLVNAYEVIIAQTTRANIALVKADIKSCRGALGEIMSDLRSNGTKKDKKEKEVQHSAAMLEAADEIDDAFNIEDLDSDTEDAANDLISECEE